MKVMDERTSGPAVAASPLVLGAIASAGAGLVHGAAAGAHNGDAALALLFALAAAGQLGWAALAMVRPVRLVALLGVGLNLGLVVVWALTRTVGMPVTTVFGGPEAVGLQDAVAAGLAVSAVGLAAWSVARGDGPEWLRRAPVAGLATALVVALTVPAMAAGHDHDHAEDSGPSSTELAAASAVGLVEGREADDAISSPAEPDVSDAADDHGHSGAHHGDHGGGPVTSLYDPRLTPEQRVAARQLIDDTVAGMQRFPDIDSVIADGYVSIGDGATGFEHFINVGYIADGRELDPERIESIVARVNPDGSREVVSAMYLMSPGSTMDDVPDIAGSLTVWYDHQDLCWSGVRVVGRVGADGQCPRGEFRGTAPMLHVWMVPHPCGPFAGLEGHGGGCGHDH